MIHSIEAFARAVGRKALRQWGRTGRKLGWHYQIIDNWGQYLAEDGPIETTLVNGCKIHCHLGDHVQRLAYFLGAYEPVETYLFMHLLRPGMCVIDAGANFGQYTLIAARAVSPGGIVHAFEPIPSNYASLQRNVSINSMDNVRLHNCALWCETAQLDLGLAEDLSSNWGSYSVGVKNERAVRSRAVALDASADALGVNRIDAMKMDIEGAEIFALRGMLNLLARTRPYILMEINRSACQRLNYSPDAIWQLLVGDLGYSGWAIGESAESSGPIQSLNGVVQKNVLFHASPLPSAVITGWDTPTLVKWAARSMGKDAA